MNERVSPPWLGGTLYRRGLLRGGVAAAVLVALSSGEGVITPASAQTLSRVGANTSVTRDQYREHVGPSVAVNPRDPRQLLVACQASPVIPEVIVTYLSFDGGATWRSGGVPPQPTAGPAGDDVTVAYDVYGRGYICATRSGHGSNINASNPTPTVPCTSGVPTMPDETSQNR